MIRSINNAVGWGTDRYWLSLNCSYVYLNLLAELFAVSCYNGIGKKRSNGEDLGLKGKWYFLLRWIFMGNLSWCLRDFLKGKWYFLLRWIFMGNLSWCLRDFTEFFHHSGAKSPWLSCLQCISKMKRTTVYKRVRPQYTVFKLFSHFTNLAIPKWSECSWNFLLPNFITSGAPREDRASHSSRNSERVDEKNGQIW